MFTSFTTVDIVYEFLRQTKAMLSLISNLLVEDLGGDSLHELEGLKTASFLKPMAVMIAKRPKMWQFFAKEQYQAYDILVQNVVEGDIEPLSNIKIHSKELINEYQKERKLDVNIGGKASLEIFSKLPQIKAEATIAGGISVNIKTNGLTLKTVDETAFEKAFRDRRVDKRHSLVAQFLRKQRRRLCVITTVLVSTGETVIECTSKGETSTTLSAEVHGQGLSANLNVKSNKTGNFSIAPDTVLACSWKYFDVDKETHKISPDYLTSIGKGGPVMMLMSGQERQKTPEEILENLEKPLQSINDLKKEDLMMFRTSLRTIMGSPTDIDNLSEVFETHDEFTRPSLSTSLPESQLENNEAFGNILRLAGFTRKGDELKWTDYSQYPLSQLVPLLSDALTGLELNELQYILETDKTQKDTIINIIKSSVNPALKKTLDVENIRSQIQLSPVADILSVMEFCYETISIQKSQKVEYVYCLLNVI